MYKPQSTYINYTDAEKKILQQIEQVQKEIQEIRKIWETLLTQMEEMGQEDNSFDQASLSDS